MGCCASGHAEARECELAPFLAPMGLDALLGDYAKEPTPQPKERRGKGSLLKFALAGGKLNVANVLAAMKGVVAGNVDEEALEAAKRLE